jgi:hypothetical protein
MVDKRMVSFGVKQAPVGKVLAQQRFERLRVLWQQCSIQRQLSIMPSGIARQCG